MTKSNGRRRRPQIAGAALALPCDWSSRRRLRKVAAQHNCFDHVSVFKGADELRRFNRLGSAGNSYLVEPLLARRAPQGSQIEVLGRGHRTAFIKIMDGAALGCKGTVPVERARSVTVPRASIFPARAGCERKVPTNS